MEEERTTNLNVRIKPTVLQRLRDAVRFTKLSQADIVEKSLVHAIENNVLKQSIENKGD